MKMMFSGSWLMIRCTCMAKVSKPTMGFRVYLITLAPRRARASASITSAWSAKRR